MIKSVAQIDSIRSSCKIAAQTLKYAGTLLKPGATTESIDDAIREYIYSLGAVPATLGYCGYPKSSCISINEVVCHGIPDQTVIKDGDIVKIDVSTIYEGYHGDNCYTFCIGDVAEDARKLVNVAKECLNHGIAAVAPNERLGTIGAAIAAHAHSNNCSVVYEYSGHGLGAKLHEPPTVPHISKADSGPRMQPGWTFTIEPMINLGLGKTILSEDHWTVRTIDNQLSAQFEHTILVTDTGYEILTIDNE